MKASRKPLDLQDKLDIALAIGIVLIIISAILKG